MLVKEFVKFTWIGGTILGVMMLVLGGAFSWGYYSTSEFDRALSIIAAFPASVIIPFVPDHETGKLSEFFSATLLVVHFAFYFTLYGTVRSLLIRTFSGNSAVVGGDT